MYDTYTSSGDSFAILKVSDGRRKVCFERKKDPLTVMLSPLLHRAHPNLLAIGFADGAVCIYDVSGTKGNISVPVKESAPSRASSTSRSGHEPIWQVSWVPTHEDKGMFDLLLKLMNIVHWLMQFMISSCHVIPRSRAVGDDIQ